MRISFDWEINPPNIRQKYKEFICRIKGHNLVKYKSVYSKSLIEYYFAFDEPNKVCSRCGKCTYKKRKNKGKTITWKRYGKLI